MMEEKTYSVSEITRIIKRMLEDSFRPMWVIGEISNFKRHGSGHLYFSLKDEQAQIRCVMFRSSSTRLMFQPEHGMQVRVYGNLGVFETQGSYQLYVESMEPAGLGALHQAFEILKSRLQAEGLFDESRKKPLPAFPVRIGIVTSETGAAIRDIMNVISRRYPIVSLVLIPVKVQGEGAADAIANAVEKFDALLPADRPDLLIVGRGGGSLEDLWAFNEEKVARAIAACRIPVISAVGHEIDFTIADFVADKRAPTPSAAAEMAVPDRRALLNQIRDCRERMSFHLVGDMEKFRLKLNRLSAGNLFQPERLVQDHRLRLDLIQSRITDSVKHDIHAWRNIVREAYSRLMTTGPQVKLARCSRMLDTWMARLIRLQERAIDKRRQDTMRVSMLLKRVNLNRFRSNLAVIAAALKGFNPRDILSRGYAICARRDGSIVTSYRDVDRNEKLEVELHEGKLDCRVEGRRFL
ncbi:exodeoxyribonuclease VII large subunit [bacterium]|nr:exodeoxyribonuclease VII large subunit [candidate division CSSED10-310 bacterium]